MGAFEVSSEMGIHSPEWALQKPYALCALKTVVVNRDLRPAGRAQGTAPKVDN